MATPASSRAISSVLKVRAGFPRSDCGFRAQAGKPPMISASTAAMDQASFVADLLE